MRGCYLFIVLIVFFSACQKQKSANPVITTTIDSVKNADSVKQVNIYPYTNTYYGPYSEYNGDIAPYNYSGFSTIYVEYLSADTIEIYGQSLGIPFSSTDYPGNINLLTRTNDSNTYAFTVQWYRDRSDFYKCTLSYGNLYCTIDQMPGPEAFDDYVGTYSGVLIDTGFKTIRH